MSSSNPNRTPRDSAVLGEAARVPEDGRPAPARLLPAPARAAIRLEDVLHALSDPVRLRVVRVLASENGGRACGTFGLPITKSTATYHYRVLRDAGVIDQWDEGTQRLNRLRRDDLEARFPGLLEAVTPEGS